MGPIENKWASGLTRRRALAALGGMFAGVPSLLKAQLDPRSTQPQVRTPSIDEMLEVFDFEAVAKDNLNRTVWNWTARGRDGEWSLRRNRIAFDWVDLVERPSGTVESVDTSTEVLGVRMNHPIYTCPSTLQSQLHPTGDAGMYQGITATGGLYVVTGNSSIGYPTLLEAADGPRWNQIYVGQNLEQMRNQLRVWLDSGSRAIAMTIDHTAAAYDSHQRIRWLGGNPPPPDAAPQAPPASEEYAQRASTVWRNAVSGSNVGFLGLPGSCA